MVRIIHQTKHWLNAAACAAHYGRYYVGGSLCATRGWRNGPRCCFELEDRGSFTLSYGSPSAAPVNVEEDEKVVNTDFSKNFFFVWSISRAPLPSVHPYDQ